MASPYQLVTVANVHKFICRCIEAAGGLPEHASCLADVLLAGDQRGHYSHGLNRLGMPSFNTRFTIKFEANLPESMCFFEVFVLSFCLCVGHRDVRERVEVGSV